MDDKEFEVWIDNAPIILYGNRDFETWLDGAPLVEQSEETPTPPTPPTPVARRRVFIF